MLITSFEMNRSGKMKKWYLSKTLWVNFVSIIALVIHGVTGVDWINPETQAMLLSLINILLRAITREEIEWADKKSLDK